MKYAIVGAGGRHAMFRTAITQTHADGNDLVALCDVNETRLALSASKIPDQKGNGIATYEAADFEPDDRRAAARHGDRHHAGLSAPRVHRRARCKPAAT